MNESSTTLSFKYILPNFSMVLVGNPESLTDSQKTAIAREISTWHKYHNLEISHELPEKPDFDPTKKLFIMNYYNSDNKHSQLYSTFTLSGYYQISITISDPTEFDVEACVKFLSIWRRNFGVTKEYFDKLV